MRAVILGQHRMIRSVAVDAGQLRTRRAPYPGCKDDALRWTVRSFVAIHQSVSV